MVFIYPYFNVIQAFMNIIQRDYDEFQYANTKLGK